jgi:hypothetical protein
MENAARAQRHLIRLTFIDLISKFCGDIESAIFNTE